MIMAAEEIKTLSQILVEAMRRYDFNVEKLSRLTDISERFLEALIEERFEKLPAVPYARGYIKKIAGLLNLDGEELWEVYLKNRRDIRRSGEKDKLPANRFALSSIFNRSAVIVIVIFILILGYFAVRGGLILSRPEISFSNLEENYTISSEPEINIKGKVKPTDVLTINSNRLYPDSEGNFETLVRLQPGLNTLEFKVRRFLGEEKTITKQIFYAQ